MDKVVVESGNLLSELDGVEGLPREHLSLQSLQFVSQLLLNSVDCLSFSFPPNHVQVLKELIHQIWREIVAVLGSELICCLECFSWYELIFKAFRLIYLVDPFLFKSGLEASLMLCLDGRRTQRVHFGNLSSTILNVVGDHRKLLGLLQQIYQELIVFLQLLVFNLDAYQGAFGRQRILEVVLKALIASIGWNRIHDGQS